MKKYQNYYYLKMTFRNSKTTDKVTKKVNISEL